MAVSTIDTVLQIAKPTRAAEPSARAGHERAAFGPALEQAQASDKKGEVAEEAPKPAEGDDEQLDAKPSAQPHQEGEERAEDTDDAAEVTEPSEEEEQPEEQPAEDVVVISALASSVVLAEEAEAAVAVHGKAIGVVFGESPKPIDAEAGGSSEGEAGEAKPATGKAQTENVQLPGDLALSANPADAQGEAKSKGAKRATPMVVEQGAAKPAPEAAAEGEAADSGAAVAQEIEVAKEEVKSEEFAASEKAVDARSSKGEEADRAELPPIEQVPELATAIERQVNPLERAGAVESASSEPGAAAPVESTNPGSNAPRGAATLDRLAAAALRRSDAAGAAEGGPPIDRPRFVQRVEGALRAAQQRDGRVQVRLAPPELGSLRIELSVQNGVMAAKLEAETPAARNALLDNLPALRERLAEQNIRVEKFDVDVRRDSQGSSGGNGGLQDGARDGNEPGSHERRGRTPLIQNKSGASKPAQAASAASAAGLDVRI